MAKVQHALIKLVLLMVLLLSLCFRCSQSEEVQYGKPKEVMADAATLAREFDLDLRAQHDLTSSTVIPQEQLMKIIAGAEKGNKGTKACTISLIPLTLLYIIMECCYTQTIYTTWVF